MTQPSPSPHPNADQVAYWNGRAGERWATLQERIDAVFEPLTRIARDKARLRAGQRALDIGCGCGATTIALAQDVGPSGHVLGIDISAPMLARAAERGAEHKVGQVGFLLADASTHAFAEGSYDLLFSRFGVMFFADPASAFRNLRPALGQDGRLLFLCWQPLADNAWMAVPLAAAIGRFPPQPPADPHGPGPYAFADPERVRAILTEAGFDTIEITPHRTGMRLGPPGDLDAALDFVAKVGPVARLLAEADDPVRALALADIRAALTRHEGRDGVVLEGAVWLVSARPGGAGEAPSC